MAFSDHGLVQRILGIALASLAAFPIHAETVVTHEQMIQRGAGSGLAMHMDGNDVFVAVEGGNGQLVMLHLEPRADNSLTVSHRVTGTQTRGQDVVTTLWGTVVTATLEPNTATGDAGGALTFDSFLLTEDEVRHLGHHRANPKPPSGDGIVFGQATQPGIGAAGPQLAPNPEADDGPGLTANPGGGQQPQFNAIVAPDLQVVAPLTPGLNAHAVSMEDVSIFTGDGGLEQERIAVAVLDEDSRLRIETFGLDEEKKFVRIASNRESGQASRLETARWSGGIVTAVRDSSGVARFIVWRILPGGGIERASTATMGAASDIDIATFNPFDGEDQYVVGIRQSDGRLRTALIEVTPDGGSQSILATGLGPRVRAVSVTPAAAPREDDSSQKTFYVCARTQDGRLAVTRWRREGGQLVSGASQTVDAEIGDLRAALTPHFANLPGGTDAVVTFARDASGDVRIDLFHSFFREITATNDLAAESRSLVFSPNSPTNLFDDISYPEDMPTTKMPRTRNCTGDQITMVRQAWRRAHYNYWRADQVMDWLRQHGDDRAAAWIFEYNEDFGSRANGYTNYAPRGWFGSYDADRFHDIRRSIDKLERDRFRERDFVVTCRAEPTVAGGHMCFTMDDLGGQHAVLGRISLCDNFFEPEPDPNRLAEWIKTKARLVGHEIAHWLKIPKSAFWLTDNHDYWEGRGRCVRDYKAVRPLYHDLAAHIANVRGCRGKNYKRAGRNIDNYAYFASQLGNEVYNGRLTEFPRQTFWSQ